MHTCCAQPTEVLGTLTLSWPPEPLPPRPPRPPTTKQLKGWCQDEGGFGTLLQPHIDDQACPDGMYACECPGLLKQRPAHHRNVLSHSPGGQSRGSGVSRLVPSGAEEAVQPLPGLRVCWQTMFLGLWKQHPSAPSSHVHVCLCPNVPFLQ